MIKFKQKIIGGVMILAALSFSPMNGTIGEILKDAKITLIARASEKVTEGNFEFEVFTDENRATLTKYNGTESVVTIPEKVGDANVTDLGFYAFYENSNLVSVNLPKELTSIDGFKKCTNLKSVDIPSKVVVISTAAFSGCSSLETVTIPEDITNIQEGAFSDCTSLKSITIPKNITTIQSNTFKNCTNLSNVTLKEGLLAIYKDAFNGCSSLKSITIPNSVSLIEDDAFSNCGMPFTVIGKSGSAAETYANKTGYTFSKEDKTDEETESTDNKDTSVSDNKTKFNIKNKKSYKNNKKITINDADGIKTVKLNSKKISVKEGANKLSFKLSKYKKSLKKKGKLNKLVVVDVNNNKITIQFKTK